MMADLRWIDGRKVVTYRIFPNLPEVKGAPDWCWTVEDFDLGDPCEGYYQTERDALDAARDLIAVRRAEEEMVP